MKHNELPQRWATKLKVYLREEIGADKDTLSATDFPYNLKIDFEDGSSAFFRYAFYLLDNEAHEVAVFTEHCGYHIFPLGGTQIEIFESKWTEVGG